MAERNVRVAGEIKKILSELIRDLKDPRVPDMLSITDVEVTRDLAHANVYYSIYGSEEEKANGKAALEGSLGFLRRELGGKMRLRKVPELHLKADDSIERGFAMDALIDKVIAEDEKNRAGQAEDLDIFDQDLCAEDFDAADGFTDLDSCDDE